MKIRFGFRAAHTVGLTCGRLLKDESGQDLIEYALVAALISLGAVASVKTLAPKISNAYNVVAANLAGEI